MERERESERERETDRDRGRETERDRERDSDPVSADPLRGTTSSQRWPVAASGARWHDKSRERMQGLHHQPSGRTQAGHPSGS